MSQSTTPPADDAEADGLTEEERDNLQWLSDYYEGEPLGEVFADMAQSDSTEETNS